MSETLDEAVRDVLEYDRDHPVSGGLRSRLDHLFNVWNRTVIAAALASPSLDVRRVKQAIANVAARHGIAKDEPPPPSLLRIYGYSAAPPVMDAEIAAEYDRLTTEER